MNAPNLEELDITIYHDKDETEANAVYQNTQLTDAFCASLHVVTIDGISWLPNEMYFIELVLSKAMVLLTMHLKLGYYKCSKSNEDARCELMTYRRVSPHAQVFFNGKEPLIFIHLSIPSISSRTIWSIFLISHSKLVLGLPQLLLLLSIPERMILMLWGKGWMVIQESCHVNKNQM